jgi:hypothetical protein
MNGAAIANKTHFSLAYNPCLAFVFTAREAFLAVAAMRDPFHGAREIPVCGVMQAHILKNVI